MAGSLSVIIPCHNYGRYLRQCVESVLTQDVDVDISIIDDSSTDDTERVGSLLADEDPRVTFQRHAVNRGHIATYNEGLERAQGRYSLLLSATTYSRRAPCVERARCSMPIRTSSCSTERCCSSAMCLRRLLSLPRLT